MESERGCGTECIDGCLLEGVMEGGSRKKVVSVVGQVSELPKTFTSKAGKDYAKFKLENDKHEVFSCIVFGDMVPRLMMDVTTLLTKLNVVGNYGDEVDEAKRNLLVASYSFPNKARTKHEHLIREYGSEEGIRKAKEEFHQAQESRGLVLCSDGRYHDKDAAVLYQDKWMSKIDLLMDYYGHKFITDELRGLTKGISSISAYLFLNSSTYKTWRDKLVSDALGNPPTDREETTTINWSTVEQ